MSSTTCGPGNTVVGGSQDPKPEPHRPEPRRVERSRVTIEDATAVGRFGVGIAKSPRIVSHPNRNSRHVWLHVALVVADHRRIRLAVGDRFIASEGAIREQGTSTRRVR